MPTDPTTAEKAERLGLAQLQGTPKWWRDNPDGSFSVLTSREVSALYAERFPAPDYRAALERLETAASAIVAAEDQLSVDDDYARALYIGAIPQLRAALTHARKVLHG